MAVHAPAAPPVQAETAPSYFSQPSTRWDVVKFGSPFLIALVWYLISGHFADQRRDQELQKTLQTIAAWQEVKEQRGIKSAVQDEKFVALQRDVDQVKGDVKEIRADIKTLLLRAGRPAGD